MSFESDVREVFGTRPSYAMYTEEGDIAVGAVVNIARAGKLTWPETYALLVRLAESNYDKYGEALDTAVRECVYDALGFESSFYI